MCFLRRRYPRGPQVLKSTYEDHLKGDGGPSNLTELVRAGGVEPGVGALSILIDGDELRFFVTGSSVTTGPLSQTTGVATLRRDGFACLTAVDDGATVLTRPLRFSGGFAFANLVGAMNWTVLAEDGSPLPPFLAANSRAGCAATAGAVNATRCPFSWQAGGCSCLNTSCAVAAARIPGRSRWRLIA